VYLQKKQKILEMKNLIKFLSITTFLSATVTVASIFYEGMVLKWFSYVGISILRQIISRLASLLQ